VEKIIFVSLKKGMQLIIKRTALKFAYIFNTVWYCNSVPRYYHIPLFKRWQV